MDLSRGSAAEGRVRRLLAKRPWIHWLIVAVAATTPGPRGAFGGCDGIPAAVVSVRALHGLARRWVVFVPAGMTATGALPEQRMATQLAVGYAIKDGRVQDNRDSLPWRGTAAGGGYSTAGDLVRFVQALQAGRLLSPQRLAQATHAQNDDGWYGFGFLVGGEAELRWFGHDGGAEGMSASLRVYPELGYVLVGLANVDPPAAERLTEYFGNRMPL